MFADTPVLRGWWSVNCHRYILFDDLVIRVYYHISQLSFQLSATLFHVGKWHKILSKGNKTSYFWHSMTYLICFRGLNSTGSYRVFGFLLHYTYHRTLWLRIWSHIHWSFVSYKKRKSSVKQEQNLKWAQIFRFTQVKLMMDPPPSHSKLPEHRVNFLLFNVTNESPFETVN